jgi:uncharacterized protein (DUF3820 family)
MKTINIKGKPYVMVNERLKEFRENFKGWSLTTEIITLSDDNCIMKATIIDDKGIIRATGFAQEDRASSMINKTSYIENCETSAWGRALGNLGIGIDDSIASAEEVNLAIAKQLNGEEQKVIGGDFVMPQGEHSGEMLKEIPAEYLDFYLEKGRNDFIKANIRKFREDTKPIEEIEV